VLRPGLEALAYDKVHLPNFNVFEEGLYFGPGQRGLLCTLPDGTRMGLAICYDLFFPEITKDLALRGADVIATISASPVTSQPYFEAVLPARALETTSFVLYCNLVGVQDHLDFWGGSRALDPLGNLLVEAPAGEEAVVTCELDLDLVELARKKRPCLRDTRMFPLPQEGQDGPEPAGEQA
ncbi:MAG: carbon-nitrogen hydrolase family protein, partial [Candidatus Thermoplasmatota archaeon]|nr:carbon-nitrogen hydrolase family protein [Candidatus Thermoplasmatota archaeon]